MCRRTTSRLIVSLVKESLDLSAILGSYRSGLGQPPFDPRMGRAAVAARSQETQTERGGVMRIILALIIALASNAALAQTQQRTFEELDGTQHRALGHRHAWQHHVLRQHGS